MAEFFTVNGQSPANQHGQWSNDWSKFWPMVAAMTKECMGVTPCAVPPVALTHHACCTTLQPLFGLTHCTCQTNEWNNMCPVMYAYVRDLWPLKLYSAMTLTFCAKRTCSHFFHDLNGYMKSDNCCANTLNYLFIFFFHLLISVHLCFRLSVSWCLSVLQRTAF